MFPEKCPAAEETRPPASSSGKKQRLNPHQSIDKNFRVTIKKKTINQTSSLGIHDEATRFSVPLHTKFESHGHGQRSARSAGRLCVFITELLLLLLLRMQRGASARGPQGGRGICSHTTPCWTCSFSLIQTFSSCLIKTGMVVSFANPPGLM